MYSWTHWIEYSHNVVHVDIAFVWIDVILVYKLFLRPMCSKVINVTATF